MPHAQRSDAELVAGAIAGDGAAFTMLFRRHVDTVHDHLVRWTRSPELATDATLSAFTALLGSLEELREGRTVLAWLLRTGRNDAVAELRRSSGSPGSPGELTTTLLAVSPARAGSEARLAEATAAGPALLQLVEGLDERALSVLDLTTRAGLSVAEVAGVIGSTPDATQLLAQRTRAAAEQSPLGADAALRAYAALAEVRAPAPLRAAIEAAIDERWAAPHTHNRWWLPLGAAAALLLVVLGSVSALANRGGDGPPVATAVAVDGADVELVGEAASEGVGSGPVAAPTPSETPSDPAPDTSSEPVEATPSEQPRQEPVALLVEVSSPVSQSVYRAGPPTADGPGTVSVPLLATVTGADPSSDTLEIVWRTSVTPGTVLLSALSGEVTLGLSAPCQDTVHELTLTVTDPETQASASDSVSVLVQHDCPPPPTVRIEAPAEGSRVSSDGVGLERRREADLAVASSSETDDGSFRYRWTSDRAPTLVLLDRASGTVTLWSDTCEPLTHVLSVQVTDPVTQQTGTASVTVTVDPTCTVE